MKHFSAYWLLGGLLLLSQPILAQTGGVGIGTTAPDASAALDIVSSSKGALLPRLTAAARLGIPRPAAGLLVYQTDAPASGTGAGTTAGFYFNAGTATSPSWQQLVTAADIASTASNGLTKTGATFLLGGPLTGATEVGLSGQNLSFSGNGNVGIGTTGPLSRLSISPTATEPKLTFFDGGSTTAHYGLGVSGGQLNYHVLTAGDRHVFYANGKNGNGAELLRIQGNGQVGIGGGSLQPTTRLTLAPTTYETKITLYNDVNGTANADRQYGFGVSNNQLNYHINQTSSSHVFYAEGKNDDGQELLRIQGDGRVGIGTSSPEAALDVYSKTAGVLLPRMETTQRDAMGSTLPTGLLIFNVSTGAFNYYDGQRWLAIAGTDARTGTQFDYTGAVQTYTVPPRVTRLYIDMAGAAGASPPSGDYGGKGGRVQGTLPVTPGTTLYLYVGGTTGLNGDVQPSSPPSTNQSGINVWGGGGATDIRMGGQALGNRVMVAGGGGGGVDISTFPRTSGGGGGGGGLTGGVGTQTNTSGSSPVFSYTVVPGTTTRGYGQGGSQSAGGAAGEGGASGNSGSPGTLGYGGAAGTRFAKSDGTSVRAGSGGGGYYGGGGGGANPDTGDAAHGGGGGSSYTGPAVSNVQHTQGVQSGHGYIVIYTQPAP